MPISNIIILAVIIGAFATFGGALAWGEHQTRHLGRMARTPKNGGAESATVTELGDVKVAGKTARQAETV